MIQSYSDSQGEQAKITYRRLKLGRAAKAEDVEVILLD